MCGMMSPTNPIAPTKDTAAAVTTVAAMRMMRRVLPTSIPRSMAWESPIMIALRLLVWHIMTAMPANTMGATTAMPSQSARLRLPMLQKTMSSVLSPAMNVRKDTTADIIDEIAIPVRRSVSVWVEPPTCATPYTRNMVAMQVTNARTGVVSAAGMKGIVKRSPTAAPRDAPEERPRMYGEAIGLRKTACITQPQAASPAPTRAPMATLRALSSTWMLFAHVPRPVMTSMTSPNDMRNMPHERSSITASTSMTAIAAVQSSTLSLLPFIRIPSLPRADK